VIILSLMETSTSSIQSLHGDIDIDLQCEQHLGCGCNKTLQQQRDQQVREGVEGGRLVDDGDIHISQSLHGDIDIDYNSVNCIRAAAESDSVDSIESSRGRDRQGDRHEQSGVERGCLDGDGDGQMQCESQMGGGCRKESCKCKETRTE
jgi:hypothetical protein